MILALAGCVGKRGNLEGEVISSCVGFPLFVRELSL